MALARWAEEPHKALQSLEEARSDSPQEAAETWGVAGCTWKACSARGRRGQQTGDLRSSHRVGLKTHCAGYPGVKEGGGPAGGAPNWGGTLPGGGA